MKLRNKKTGKITEARQTIASDGTFALFIPMEWGLDITYNTLSDLVADWEDYTPQEPKIKDKNIRKAVRTWAYINDIAEVQYAETNSKNLCVLTDFEDDFDYCIEFVGWIPTLKDSEIYTITELCGEEEDEN